MSNFAFNPDYRDKVPRRGTFDKPVGYDKKHSNTARSNDAEAYIDYGRHYWPSRSEMLVPKK